MVWCRREDYIMVRDRRWLLFLLGLTCSHRWCPASDDQVCWGQQFASFGPNPKTYSLTRNTCKENLFLSCRYCSYICDYVKKRQVLFSFNFINKFRKNINNIVEYLFNDMPHFFSYLALSFLGHCFGNFGCPDFFFNILAHCLFFWG